MLVRHLWQRGTHLNFKGRVMPTGIGAGTVIFVRVRHHATVKTEKLPRSVNDVQFLATSFLLGRACCLNVRIMIVLDQRWESAYKRASSNLQNSFQKDDFCTSCCKKINLHEICIACCCVLSENEFPTSGIKSTGCARSPRNPSIEC